MKLKNTYIFGTLLMAITGLTSCVEEDLGICDSPVTEIDEFKKGYSLSFTVTLDNMGGEIATRTTDKQLQDFENYIDPEKFRVLFFDSGENFLFESKSRWVRKMENNSQSTWFVSVPIFTYGNEEEWDWEGIRNVLTTQEFRIAILANRPGTDYFPDLDDNALGGAKWFDNSGPHWGPESSICGGTAPKKVFDLHHSQWDPIYDSKGRQSGYSENFYKFAMGTNEKGEITMSSTSSWVNWESTSALISGKRDFIVPNTNHPIPMYGIQKFQPIKGWKEGSTFDLNRDGDEDIALLRSVVRLELLLPKDKVKTAPTHVAIAYPNIYARCEPMDVWTPTDQLWKQQEVKAPSGYCIETDLIMSYGPLCLTTDSPSASTLDDFKKRYSWFYGIWEEEKGWKGLNNQRKDLDSPRIFNSVIQRNGVVAAINNLVDDGTYWRYVVYTGERNISDASALTKLGDAGSGKPTVIYWMFNYNGKLYGVPITDYKASGNPALNITTENFTTGAQSHTYVNGTYMADVMKLTGEGNKAKLPWPLVRNHVYKISVGAGLPTTRSDEEITLGDLEIMCEDLHSENL